MTATVHEDLRQRLSRTLEGRYAVAELLGAGGMAAVFRAQDLALERPVAIKVLPPSLSHDEHLVSRFQQEAKLAAKLDHPGIIPIYRVESESGLDYFVMKFVAGRSVDDLLAPGQPLDTGLTMRVLIEAAAALGHAHKRGVVHRDVKPANIMLEEDQRVILTDFGISKAIESAGGLTRTGIIVGTPHYMAPEQAMGLPVDGRADQYALACVGYQMLTGELPFPGDIAHSVLHRHIYVDAEPIASRRSNVPRAMEAALERALSKEPASRFRSMEEFAAAMKGEAAAPRAPLRPVRTAGANPRAAMAPTVSLEGPTAPMNSSASIEYEQRVASGRRWRVARWAAALVVVAAAGVAWSRLGGSVASGSTPPASADETASDVVETPPPPPAPRMSPLPAAVAAKPAAHKAGVQTAAKTVARRPAPHTNPKPQPEAPAAPLSFSSASITIDANPSATVYLDGRKLGVTPIDAYAVSVGRSYEVTVEREGYKTMRETIRMVSANEVRRRYVLEPTQP